MLLLIFPLHPFPFLKDILDAHLPGDLFLHRFLFRHRKADLSVILLGQYLIKLLIFLMCHRLRRYQNRRLFCLNDLGNLRCMGHLYDSWFRLLLWHIDCIGIFKENFLCCLRNLILFFFRRIYELFFRQFLRLFVNLVCRQFSCDLRRNLKFCDFFCIL